MKTALNCNSTINHKTQASDITYYKVVVLLIIFLVWNYIAIMQLKVKILPITQLLIQCRNNKANKLAILLSSTNSSM